MKNKVYYCFQCDKEFILQEYSKIEFCKECGTILIEDVTETEKINKEKSNE